MQMTFKLSLMFLKTVKYLLLNHFWVSLSIYYDIFLTPRGRIFSLSTSQACKHPFYCPSCRSNLKIRDPVSITYEDLLRYEMLYVTKLCRIRNIFVLKH
jgi:hypothetical protein